mmetsp:Transcript_32271/g.61790  ORF Transcript_32271/g.61790 Transcript_32271/m.61790 type:complete len:93 (+) Transcript_32271:396-674(+)
MILCTDRQILYLGCDFVFWSISLSLKCWRNARHNIMCDVQCVMIFAFFFGTNFVNFASVRFFLAIAAILIADQNELKGFDYVNNNNNNIKHS